MRSFCCQLSLLMSQRAKTVVDFDPVHTRSYFTGIFRDLDTPDVLDPLLSSIFFSFLENIFSGTFHSRQCFAPARIYFNLKTSIFQGAPVTVCLSLLDYLVLVYTTQVNSTFRARWLASSEVISQVLFTSEQPKENKMAFVAIFSQIKLLFGPLVIQLAWYILKQLFTSVSVKLVDIYLHFGE